jgi:hypothetical protein
MEPEMEPEMEELEASAVPAIVLLSILRREMEAIVNYLSDRFGFTQAFNHLLLRLRQTQGDVQFLRGHANE